MVLQTSSNGWLEFNDESHHLYQVTFYALFTFINFNINLRKFKFIYSF